MIGIENGSIFHIATDNTSYIVHILPSGHAEHLYYGKRLRDAGASLTAIREKRYISPGMATYISEDDFSLALDDSLLEFSSEGKGDYRVPLIALSWGDKGERTADFRFSGYRKHDGILTMGSGLPQAKDKAGEAETLELIFDDDLRQIELRLIYTVFPSLDAITRRSIVTAKGKNGLMIRALASAQLDFRTRDMAVTTFSGTWAREFGKTTRKIEEGSIVSESRRMASSAEANPGFILEDSNGTAYICNLIYSGPHRAVFSQTPHGLTHIVWGINPDMFSWPLNPGESFTSPEAVIVCSPDGLWSASEKMHAFADSAIIRSVWSSRMRPLMLNTWEGAYYALSEKRVLDMAEGAKEMGLEGIIVDDGWFGARRNDRTSVGDWHANTMKFPEGLFEVSESVHRMGLLFGLWFEPEGISGKSLLYKEHPDWIIGRTDEENAKGRSEELLDLTRQDVRDWIVNTVSSVIDRCRVDYLRWDMSRHYSDIFSYQDIKDYGTFCHKYILGLYQILGSIGRRFPGLYIETSASGGARFDLGMLCYSASIWLSVDSDPIERASMIANAAMLYPLSVIESSVSPSPNSMTHRITDRETRFNVAAFGVLSYSLDPSTLSRIEMAAFRQQVEFYKSYRMLSQFGSFRLEENGNRIIWSVASKDRSTILMLYLQKRIIPNTSAEKIFVSQASSEYDYRIFSRSHLLTDQEASSYPQESECYTVPGDALKYAGVSLVEQVSGNGYREGMRMLGDFSSRLYIIRRIED